MDEITPLNSGDRDMMKSLATNVFLTESVTKHETNMSPQFAAARAMEFDGLVAAEVFTRKKG